MKISKKEDFGLIFMSILAKNYSDRFIPLSLVAKQSCLSLLFLKHIANNLKDKGLIESKEGIAGGYHLSRKPQDIAIADILGSISKGVVTPGCQSGVCRIKKENCSCFSFWGKVNKKLFSYLSSISLWEYINT